MPQVFLMGSIILLDFWLKGLAGGRRRMNKAHFFPLMFTSSYIIFLPFFPLFLAYFHCLYSTFAEMDWLWTFQRGILGEKRPTCWFHVNMVALVQCFGSKASASRFLSFLRYISPIFAFGGRWYCEDGLVYGGGEKA